MLTAVADGCNVYFKKEEKPVIVDANFYSIGNIILESVSLEKDEEIVHTYVRIEGDSNFYEPDEN